jgi:D-3-phosphoglycerate dehydrogenase
VVMLLRAFDCQALAHDLLDFPEFYRAHQVTPRGLEDLIRSTEIVTIHLPLDYTTRDMFNGERLALMRGRSYLINGARGGCGRVGPQDHA